MDLAPGMVRASPFQVSKPGPGERQCLELVTGRRYQLSEAEDRLLAACRDDRALASLNPEETNTCATLLDRLLILDRNALNVLGGLGFRDIDFEVSGACNASCVFCPRDRLKQGRGANVMSRHNFEVIVEKLLPVAHNVGFVGIGEPTLNRYLPEFVAHFKRHGKTVIVVTNGSLLDDRLIDALMAAGLDALTVSFTGLSKASYEDHMVGLKFEDVMSRIDNTLTRTAGRLPVSLTAVQTLRNREELVEFEHYWQTRGASAYIVPCHTRGSTIVEPTLIDNQWPKALHGRSEPAAMRCALFNARAFIAANGDVLACCHDISGQTVLGNLLEESVETIAARKLAVIASRTLFPLCRNCDEPRRHELVALG